MAISPFVGRSIDKYGTGVLIAGSSFITGLCALGLALVSTPWGFYSLYIPGRMIFSGPLELGLPTAISNWFIRRRPLGLAVDTIAKGAGLAIIPVTAQMIIGEWGWRSAWSFLGILTLCVGVIPSLILIARRPEDMGLVPDPLYNMSKSPKLEVAESSNEIPSSERVLETNFTLTQALKTQSFWILAAFTAAGFMVQGGVSLHQVAHYINQGIPGTLAALSAGTYAAAQIIGGLFWGFTGRRVPVRFLLSASALVVGIGVIGTILSSKLPFALTSAATIGFGVGGLHLLVRLAWADYYGREHLGTIRGITLSAQIGGQALGPVLAGFLFDMTSSYQLPFVVFATAVVGGGLFVLGAVAPRIPLNGPPK